MKTTIDYINTLNPYEHQGYNVCRLRELKNSLLEFPERAKIAIEIRNFVRLNLWEYKEGELSGLAAYFYNEYKSINEFLDIQIECLKKEIERNEFYLKNEKNKKTIEFWTNANKSRLNEIEKMQSLKN